uniref:Signal peptide protein n=1 Tax=Heterorhabditis bacteriophora TaxID=37862 RepID=A0A1I7WAV1_HETBA
MSTPFIPFLLCCILFNFLCREPYIVPAKYWIALKILSLKTMDSRASKNRQKCSNFALLKVMPNLNSTFVIYFKFLMPTEIPQSECRESSLSSLNNAPDSTVSTYSTTVSRRRMAFRPPAVLETRMDSGLGPIATISSGHNYSTEVLPSQVSLFITINSDFFMATSKMFFICFIQSTSIRVKKRTIVIKTPPCPSLLKFFTQHRLLDKFPPEIIISLKPMTYRDASYVVTCEQNPLIRIRVAANDRLSRIFHLLKQKWASPLERMATDGHGGVFKSYIELRIFPGKDTEVGRVVVSESEISPSVGISINKLVGYLLFCPFFMKYWILEYNSRLKKEYELRRLLHTKRSSNLVTNTAYVRNCIITLKMQISSRYFLYNPITIFIFIFFHM